MELKNVGVIGCGTMGNGISQIAATHGHEVVLVDMQEESLIAARDKLIKILNRQVEKARMTDNQVKEILGRIHYTTKISALSDCNLVIEAIVENFEIKKQVFAEVEQLVSEECILATNTSSISITALANNCKNAHRFLGIHFFNPAPLMPLVELIPALQTNLDYLSLAKKTITNWNKHTVVVKDTPGFIVNRIARPFYSEALRILEEGIADVRTIDQVILNLGFRMGPFTLMDYIGNDVNYKVTETVWKAFYHDSRFTPSLVQKNLVDAGYLGRKSGKGFYDYPNQLQEISVNKEDSEQIGNRILFMLINFAADALYLEVASKRDIETAMTKGVNYPKGLLEWGSEIGFSTIVHFLDDLYHRYHEERYRVSPWLRMRAGIKA